MRRLFFSFSRRLVVIPIAVNSMKQALIKSTVASLSLGMLISVGCGPSTAPTGPEEGSIQAYLDENPDVAARINEGDGPDEADEAADDGTGE